MYIYFKYLTLIFVTILCILSFFIHKNQKSYTKINQASVITNLYQTCINLLDRYWLIALAAIFIVFLFTRFHAIDVVPAGVHLDEIGYWIDVQNLFKYGTDRLGNRYPWMPVAYGDGQSPLYSYMCVLALHFFPFSIKTMRCVMAVSAIPCFFASFGIVNQLYESKRYALLGPILVTVTPYFFSASRWGLNAYQMLFLCTIALYFLIKGIKHGHSRDYVFSGIFMGLSLLAHILAYIMLPIFFILTFAYLLWVREFRWKNVIATFIPCFIIGMPTVLVQFVNMDLIKPFYFLGSDYNKLTFYRIDEVSELTLGVLLKNLSNIIPSIFGDTKYTYNSIAEFGTIFWCTIPLLIVGKIISIIGLYRSLKTRTLNLFVPVLLFSLSIYLGFLTDSGCNTYKINAIYIGFVLFIIAGIRYISGYSVDACLSASLNDVKKTHDNSSLELNISDVIKKGSVLATLCVIALSFLLYSEFYFRRLNNTYGYLSLFISTLPGDIVNYEEALYNPNGDKTVYMELEYSNRDYSDWLIALYTEMDAKIFNKYDEDRRNAPEELKNKIPMDHFVFAFPEEFDEDENAVYILGNSWDHISGYLIGVGFNCDESFPGYKILYK